MQVDDSGKVQRLRKVCPAPTCGPGIFMATHFNRVYWCAHSRNRHSGSHVYARLMRRGKHGASQTLTFSTHLSRNVSVMSSHCTYGNRLCLILSI